MHLKYLSFYLPNNNYVPSFIEKNKKEPLNSKIKDSILEAIKNLKQNKQPRKNTPTFEIKKVDTAEELDSLEPTAQALLLSTIKSHPFTMRLDNSLSNLGIKYIGQIFCLEFKNFKSLPNFGTATQNELNNFLNSTFFEI